MNRCQAKAPILRNTRLQGSYYRVDLLAPAIVPEVRPGQFVHVQLPEFEHHLLRRPFSIFNVEEADGTLSIIYKIVGEGTAHLARLAAGTSLDLMGPLGNGYPEAPPGATPVVVAGGYGCAATYLFARRSQVPGVVCLGGRSAEDLLLVAEYTALGWAVLLATDDGSRGQRGLVTDLLDRALGSARRPYVVACGPNPMLKAVCRLVAARGLEAQVSLDHAMCCGVGACFACVVKLKADTAEGWEYVRTCKSGPVFAASAVVWD
jgi:dihydroorotate dehydrogenase electron transfer subunit